MRKPIEQINNKYGRWPANTSDKVTWKKVDEHISFDQNIV